MSWKGDQSLRKLLVPIGGLEPLAASAFPAAVDALVPELVETGQRRPVVISDDGGVTEGVATIAAALRLGWTHLAACAGEQTVLAGQTSLGDFGPRADERLVAVLTARRDRDVSDAATEIDGINERSISGYDGWVPPPLKVKEGARVVISCETPDDLAALRLRLAEYRGGDLATDDQMALTSIPPTLPETPAWGGLPRFVPVPQVPKQGITLAAEEERDELLRFLGIETIHKRTRGTLSVWWPPKLKEDLASLRFVGGRLPRYPIYVPTKGRYHAPMTIDFLKKDGVPFFAVVEESEYRKYLPIVGRERLLVLPESGNGLLYARNWIRDHAEASGAARHWQLDDNIKEMRRLYRGRRIPCDSGTGFAVVEDLSDRYRNVAISGLNYQMFVPSHTARPFLPNVHVYSATLVNHAFSGRWRLLYNDDTDLCLQVLTAPFEGSRDRWATIQVSAFMVQKMPTMKVKGGNTDSGGVIEYQGDGRLKMAWALADTWPGVVTVDERHGRAQHVVDWGRFRHPLLLRDGVDPTLLPPDEYGSKLVALRDPRAEQIRRLLEEAAA